MPRNEESRPDRTPGGLAEAGSSTALSLADRAVDGLPDDVVEYFNRCAVRNVEQAIIDARPSTWEKRAQDLENARPRLGEFHGRATSAELSERDQRLAEQAAAARLHARFLREYPTPLTQFERSVVAAIIGGGE